MSLLIATALILSPFTSTEIPRLGQKAPDFALKTMNDRTVELKKLRSTGPVVLVVLRGFPGYQCPLCTRQVGELISRSAQFTKQNAQVLLVYPGPAENLKDHAREFTGDKELPKGFTLVVDPNFRFVNQYGLRWDAPAETAYPSTFIIDKKGTVVFAKVSHSHGDRAKVEDVLNALTR